METIIVLGIVITIYSVAISFLGPLLGTIVATMIVCSL